jgi:hypothetical protein
MWVYKDNRTLLHAVLNATTLSEQYAYFSRAKVNELLELLNKNPHSPYFRLKGIKAEMLLPRGLRFRFIEGLLRFKRS